MPEELISSTSSAILLKDAQFNSLMTLLGYATLGLSAVYTAIKLAVLPILRNVVELYRVIRK